MKHLRLRQINIMVWIISHCLWLVIETTTYTACRATFLWDVQMNALTSEKYNEAHDITMALCETAVTPVRQ